MLRWVGPHLLSVIIVAGCASSDVTSRRVASGGQDLERPARIIVRDIAASPNDIPPDSAVAQYYARRSAPQTADEIRLGRSLGQRVSSELVKEILSMGLPAERAGSGPPARVGDVIIGGEFVSINEGSRLKRMLIGFGAAPPN